MSTKKRVGGVVSILSLALIAWYVIHEESRAVMSATSIREQFGHVLCARYAELRPTPGSASLVATTELHLQGVTSCDSGGPLAEYLVVTDEARLVDHINLMKERSRRRITGGSYIIPGSPIRVTLYREQKGSSGFYRVDDTGKVDVLYANGW